ncbi:MAG: hypothetical protein KF871_00305 [Hydrogenophaga sp.]|uniref:hypothetical protein n=1 Tax=Hydrogenophaga sp. TaxID=1904254 RepID=UPI001D512881|nr:hypothetical protein [Hydrogenophaga sp.]MBX3608306.1 hypothetical protein [Hydrogenophaga sp.]
MKIQVQLPLDFSAHDGVEPQPRHTARVVDLGVEREARQRRRMARAYADIAESVRHLTESSRRGATTLSRGK